MHGLHATPFKHVFGTALKAEYQYQNMRIATSAIDSNYIACSDKYFAVAWQAGGGGALGVFPHEHRGKMSSDPALFNGHKGQINDFAFHPYNSSLIASCSDDCTVQIWGIPDGGLKESTTDSLCEFTSHSKKVSMLRWHPTAENVLASAAYDHTIKLYDVERGLQCSVDGIFTKELQDMSFNQDGSKMVAYAKDKKLRMLDPRKGSSSCVSIDGLQGTKGGRCLWLGKPDKIFTVGFSKSTERQIHLYDPRQFDKPYHSMDIDVSSGLIMPLWDEDTNMIYLVGKGDGNIRYYEYMEKAPYCYLLSQWQSPTPQRGAALMPKLTLDVLSCEVARLYRLENSAVVPIMFQVPRKAESFQKDLFPETRSPVNAPLTASQYFGGSDAEPKYVSMEMNSPARSAVSKVSGGFAPKVAKAVKLPPKTSDPRKLQAQNDELRKIVADLEKELAAL